MYYILLQLKHFIKNYSTLWSYYELRQKVITNYSGQYKLRRYYKLRRNKSYKKTGGMRAHRLYFY